MRLKKTNRGFKRGEFIDQYGEECSLQESSLATDNCIWLGINRPKVKVLGKPVGTGWVDVPLPDGAEVFGRMHLNRKMVANLLPALQKFAKTGAL